MDSKVDANYEHKRKHNRYEKKAQFIMAKLKCVTMLDV